jgi:hypothetical protein
LVIVVGFPTPQLNEQLVKPTVPPVLVNDEPTVMLKAEADIVNELLTKLLNTAGLPFKLMLEVSIAATVPELLMVVPGANDNDDPDKLITPPLLLVNVTGFEERLIVEDEPAFIVPPLVPDEPPLKIRLVPAKFKILPLLLFKVLPLTMVTVPLVKVITPPELLFIVEGLLVVIGVVG